MRKAISGRVEKLYMRTFISYYRKTGNSLLLLSLPDFESLRNRDDYRLALGELEALGLIDVRIADGIPWDIVLTDKAILYYRNRRIESSERRRSRLSNGIGMVVGILSLLIATLAFLHQLYASGFFNG